MIVAHTSRPAYALGLDIGSSSIGWACLRLQDGRPRGVLAAGVRLFEAGMSGSAQDFQQGKEASRAAERRTARLLRRQYRRRRARRRAVFQLLQQAGLLPPDDVSHAAAVTPFIERLDASLRARYCPDGDDRSAQLLVYRIRGRAAREPVEPYDLGRALLHLAKRRGFSSNLRGTPKDKDDGEVKPAIQSLQAELDAAGQTLGQFLAQQDPYEKQVPQRGVRKRWTARDMYLQEFERIWEVQARTLPQLTETLRKRLRRAIFFQRPLRSAKGLVGKCSLEPKRRRLAAAHPLAQEARMLQFVNNVRVRRRGEVDRPLTAAERARAIDALSACRGLRMKEFRAELQLPKGCTLNFAGDEDDLARGLGTVADLRSILGPRWDAFAPAEQERLFYEVLSFNRRDALIRRCRGFWALDEQQAERLADLTLEPGYARHSRVAYEKLLPHLREQDALLGRWPTYAEAKLRAYPDVHTAEQPLERLPPVVKHLANVTNPSVIRALTEVRKVVNELLQRFGKPERIHLELARDLKRSKKERKRVEEILREQTDRRRKALQRIRQEFTGYPEKPGYDRGIEMVLLAEECNWTCPYTGEAISCVRDLIGDNSRFDIEHIFPRRFLDDSFGNKTLCLHDENRHVKRDRLPKQAYADKPKRYAEIIERVKKFKGPAAARKLERFQADEVPSDFSARQLNETRYVTVAAADYLGLLYGGRIDADHRQRVFTLTGGLTAILRGQWRLNQILGAGHEKNRQDHRHHAVDAIVAACTDQGTIATLQSAAAAAWERGDPRGLPRIDPPWPQLLDEAGRAVLEILVSHRQNRRLNGPLHADSNYAPPVRNAAGQEVAKIHTPLVSLTEAQIQGDAIVDPAIRALVRLKYAELKASFGKSSKPKDVFNALENHPALVSKKGARIPIHAVRVWVRQKPFAARPGDPTRYVAATGGSNFCLRILSIVDQNGLETGWRDELVTRREALQNRNRPTPDPLERFTLFINEFVLMPDAAGVWQLYRVLSLSQGDIEVRLHCDGRKRQDVESDSQRVRIRSGAFKKRSFRKVAVSPTGLLTDALTNDPVDLKTLAKHAAPKQTPRKRRRQGDGEP